MSEIMRPIVTYSVWAEGGPGPLQHWTTFEASELGELEAKCQAIALAKQIEAERKVRTQVREARFSQVWPA